MTGGESVAFTIVRRDHQQLREQLAEARAAPDSAQGEQLRTALASAIEHHLAMEEHALYPPLRAVGAIASFMGRMDVQHELIREALSVSAAAEGDAIGSTLDRLAERLDEHFREEEQRLFDYAREYLAGKLEILAIELEQERNAARGAYGVG